MPYDGSGIFSRVHDFTTDRDNGIKILADRMDAEFDGIATGLTRAYFRDGTIPMAGNVNLGNYRVNNFHIGTAGNPSISFSGDATTGLYRPAVGSVSIVGAGAAIATFAAAGSTVASPLSVTGNATIGDAAGDAHAFSGTVTFNHAVTMASTLAVTGAVTASNLSGTHSGTSSGNNTGDQTIELTGDVTGTGTGSFAATIGANKVTFAKFVAATQAAFVAASGAGNFGEKTPTEATAMLSAMGAASGGAGGAKGLVPASAAGDQAKFLRADATWQDVASGWTQIATSTPTGTGTVTFSSIPTTYSDLLVVLNGVSHDNGASQGVQFTMSDDGTNWPTALTMSGNISAMTAALLGYGHLFIPGYRRNTGLVYQAGSFPTNRQTVSIAASHILWRLDGGISAVRISLTAGNFDAGTITLYGR